MTTSDHPLEQTVMTALAGNPLVHADEIVVQAFGSDVTLRGAVATLVQRTEAMRTARDVPGVGHVEDLLHVRPLGVDARTDADTEAAVLAALIEDGDVPAGDIDVDADGDRLTLRGFVELPAQRDRAERVALRVGGVAHVENKLDVLLLVSADDVAERVTNAIGFDAIVGADRIRVDVSEDNDVTLTGTVRTPEHRAAALAAAANVPGVAEVHDQITVR
jgi:osmotically-inducible protein OsmY